jgi:3-phosphoshikimate 1-carboxyvinyltransferase
MSACPPFFFEGPIPASKSVLIRWLVVASHGGPLRIDGDSRCDDVVAARAALAALDRGGVADVGEGAFGFRSLALRAARRPGVHRFRLGERLSERPHGPLLALLRALGVRADVRGREWRLEGDGWKVPETPLEVDGAVSSQFASALLVNGWNLPAPLTFCAPLAVSEGYFALTRRQVAAVGLDAAPVAGSTWRIPAGRSVRAATVRAEPDMSSAFAVAALAAVAGEARLVGLSDRSLAESGQPDRVFPELLRRLGAPVVVDGAGTTVRQAARLEPLDVDLGGAPDLFPVLAALVACAPGPSRLFGAPQLRAKESDRIAAVARLLRGAGVVCDELPDGLVVHGRSPAERPSLPPGPPVDPERDHRLVMAAAVLKAAGLPIEIAGIPVVAKSFPEFADLLARSALA